MAKSQNNIVMYGASGQLGNQIVFRKGRGGQMIISAMPATGRTFTPTQLTHQEAFRNAIAYAKSAKDETAYITKAQGTTMTAFNAAVADWFNQPEVLEIDATNWTGAIGETIRVKAQDDTHVTKVRVQIVSAGGSIIEEGDAAPADGLWWEYTTTTSLEGNILDTTVKATAHDLPGNNHMLLWQNN